jgi:hypothetical protein
MGIGVMTKALALAVAGLVTTVAFSSGASAGSVSVSRTTFTTFDGRVCTTVVKRMRNDFGDFRKMRMTRCGGGFAMF